MKRMKKIFDLLFAVVIVAVFMIAPHADTVITIDGYSFVEYSSGLGSLVGWDNSSDTLYVPAKVGGVYMAAIGDSAFNEDDYIKTLDITDATRLYSIGKFAFCDSVLEGYLNIPARVTNVGVAAFQHCNISELDFSSSSGIVPAQCFQYCENLHTVVLSDHITTIERYAFRGCAGLTNVTISATVTTINPTAFNGCEDLVIYCYAGSYAQQYAEEKGIEYELLIPPEDPTDPPTEPPTDAPTDAPTEPMTDAPTEAPTADGSYLLGDVDGNGDVDALDATLILRYCAGIDIKLPDDQVMHGDVDSDGDISVIDATLILRFVADIHTPYPIGESISG